MQLANTYAVFISAAKGGVIGRDTFQRVTGLKQIKLGFWVVREKFYQRVAEALPQAVLHKGSATTATGNRPFASRRWIASRREGRETSNCFASSRSGGSFSPGRSVPSRIKTPAAAQSHRKVLVGEFCCRPYSLSYAFLPGVNWSYQFHVRIAKVTKYSPSVHIGFD